ncbi:MAG: hypothetical protein PHQ43_12280 [Dehalococcoidales bacterium]|nr:hypothetical protein [Dehalococcoidales bacterium]
MSNGGRGYRRMYQITGLPGWMRLGYSPGWQGRSSTGLGPCASYMTTGRWPTAQAQAYWQAMQAGETYPPYYGASGAAPGTVPSAPRTTREEEYGFLKEQAAAIKDQLAQIEDRIHQLEKKEK